MSKGIIVVNMPDCCNQCKFWFAKSTNPIEYRCMIKQRNITEKNLNEEKPDWCPIKELPIKLEEIKCPHSMSDYQRKGFSRGYNACLDAIEEGE